MGPRPLPGTYSHLPLAVLQHSGLLLSGTGPQIVLTLLSISLATVIALNASGFA